MIPFSNTDIWIDQNGKATHFFDGDGQRNLVADNGNTYVATKDYFMKYGWKLDNAEIYKMPLHKALNRPVDLRALLTLNSIHDG